MSQKRTKFSCFLFVLYGLLMLWLLFGQRMGQTSDATYWARVQANLNLQPFETLRRFWWVLVHRPTEAAVRHALINLVGNVVMFLPLGFLTPCIFPKLRRFWWHLAAMVLIIFCIELLQLFTLLGSFDVDDLILNLVGTTLGFGIWKLTGKTK